MITERVDGFNDSEVVDFKVRRRRQQEDTERQVLQNVFGKDIGYFKHPRYRHITAGGARERELHMLIGTSTIIIPPARGRILSLLESNVNWYFQPDELTKTLTSVKGELADSKAVAVHVHYLRMDFEGAVPGYNPLQTLYGFGYRIEDLSRLDPMQPGLPQRKAR